MKLHEYQSKFRFAEFGIPIPRGKIATTPEEAFQIAKEIGGPTVVKAQVLVGGRGKAGGVKLARTPEEAEQHAASILGMNIKGLTVKKVLIDPAADIRTEIYLGVTTDRTERRTVVMASSEGGMDIEEVAAKSPDKIVSFSVDPASGLSDFHGRRVAFALGLSGDQVKQCGALVKLLYKAFVEKDMEMLEINPLIVTEQGQLKVLDAKVGFDNNALYRQKDIVALRDETEEDPKELEASKYDLNYIALDGEIGCMVNGAGLAMATMDIIKLYGAEPANFLDVGGGATKEKVTEAFKIITSDPNVKGILVNIFGGIMRADEVARGVVEAIEKVKPNVPFVARLVGTNEAEGREILNQANMITATSLAEAAKLAVEAAQSAS